MKNIQRLYVLSSGSPIAHYQSVEYPLWKTRHTCINRPPPEEYPLRKVGCLSCATRLGPLKRKKPFLKLVEFGKHPESEIEEVSTFIS